MHFVKCLQEGFVNHYGRYNGDHIEGTFTFLAVQNNLYLSV